MSGRQSPFPQEARGPAAPSRKRLCGMEQGSPGPTQVPRAQWPSAQAGPTASSSLSIQHRKHGQDSGLELNAGPSTNSPLQPGPPHIFQNERRRAQSPLEHGEEGQHGPAHARSRPVEPGLVQGAIQTAVTSLHAGPLFIIPSTRT